MTKLTLGINLTTQDRRHVLSAYVHRHTGTHRPAWVTTEPLHFANDTDWLNHTAFSTRGDGSLDGRFTHCISNPTWPNNPELRR